MLSSVSIKEAEVVKLVLDFLSSRQLHISMRALERESGVVNGLFSDDVLFLRQLVLDGQWDDVLQFIQPLEAVSAEKYNLCRFLVQKEKYLEMLCMRSERELLINGASIDFNIDEVVECLHGMEKIAPSREEYNSLCLLLTVQRLADHPEYKHWNPSTARLACFNKMRPIVERVLPPDPNLDTCDFTAGEERLMQLLVQGMLYESCLHICQTKANSPAAEEQPALGSTCCSNLLQGEFGTEVDPSLISWLEECVPLPVFTAPFEQRDVHVSVSKMIKPPSASWFEQILLTPTPAQLTPGMFKSMPSPARFTSRPRTADKTSLSIDYSQLQPATGPAAAGAPGDVSRSYHHFTYRPSESTIEEESSCLQSSLNKAGPLRTSRSISENACDKSNAPAVDRLVLEEPLDNGGVQDTSIKGQVSGASGGGGGGGPLQVSSTRSPSKPPLASSNTLSASTAVVAPQQMRPAKSAKDGSAGNRRPVSLPDEGPALRHSSSEPQRSVTSSQSRRSTSAAVGDTLPPVVQPASPHIMASPKDVPVSELRFRKMTSLVDAAAVRSVAFHPNGISYAVGANSKVLRVFATPCGGDGSDSCLPSPEVLWAKKDVHKGSIYCVDWSSSGDLIATGSNDKVIKLIPVEPSTHLPKSGQEVELTMHDGTVRDLVFAPPSFSVNPLLVSGGAGDCNIYVTDCVQATALHAFTGHAGAVLSVFGWGTYNVCSGSQDKTIRLWDLRTSRCTDVIPGGGGGGEEVNFGGGGGGYASSAVASVCVNRAGVLLAYGTEDGGLFVHDLRAAGARSAGLLTRLPCHTSDVRSVRFAPSSPYLLLSGSYDSSLVLSDLKEAVPKPVVVGRHVDKVIQSRWHPQHLSFVSTSADKTASYWVSTAGTH